MEWIYEEPTDTRWTAQDRPSLNIPPLDIRSTQKFALSSTPNAAHFSGHHKSPRPSNYRQPQPLLQRRI
ncbi:hypothetical protein JAAARDRAFT_61940 [Jaapia argillacea MUCL 33604]|uniref:Uncharacterized protein n=1 Tax=Jaapia argillacea MUCL 33604 TaxID=933084 RepID=A0A067PEX8_9AGAM|nr:hypothetical protein JAAARDRAFT_61940 [Jaapia argillacea MUCL 33604]